MVGGGVFIVSAAAQAPPPVKPPEDAYQQIFQEQIARTKRYEGLLARQEEMMKRQEDLMKRQEDGAVRFLLILRQMGKAAGAVPEVFGRAGEGGRQVTGEYVSGE